MWFQDLVGFQEISAENVLENIALEGEFLTSAINGRSLRCGRLEIPTLQELRERTPLSDFEGKIQLEEVVGDAMALHKDIANENAVFQAASQFNLLEMAGPGITPEAGVDGYENDKTQGPACAIACGAGTIYRNYFVPLNGRIGQSADNQIDCLEEIGRILGNDGDSLWEIRNGYAMFSEEGLATLNGRLADLTGEERENLKAQLKVGIQWNTEVTAAESGHTVSQVYCSALPVGYHYFGDSSAFEAFSRLILEAAYEATFYAAVENWRRAKSPKLFLTLVGGGVFGNETCWILDAINISLEKFREVPLEVKVVSYGSLNSQVGAFCQKF
ncbi:hypothetical protein SAMN05443429_10195 [Cruoricaptor ignavus]|uniref:Uncharacterized protein n=1 Tax=Cruoricaptor ignavus TaxID=1118202 RepID=A0A1M6A1A6_9FLAO|nr:hypothetical protein [Cruoricaptor ignavus]SHI30208.1 hypothetical protein SAMN05443429_10195 [Cruoricaptor ignavus]